MKKSSSGRNLDANLEITPVWKCCPLVGNAVPYLVVQALHMPRSKNSSGIYRPKYTKKAHFSLISLSVYPRSRRCAERIRQGRGALKPPHEDGARTKPFDREFQFRESHTPPADVICVIRSRKNGFEPIYIRLTCRPSTLKMRNISTVPNAII